MGAQHFNFPPTPSKCGFTAANFVKEISDNFFPDKLIFFWRGGGKASCHNVTDSNVWFNRPTTYTSQSLRNIGWSSKPRARAV